MRVLDAASGGLPYRVPYPDKAAAAEAVSETPVAEESPAAAKPLAAEESSLESDLKRVATPRSYRFSSAPQSIS